MRDLRKARKFAARRKRNQIWRAVVTGIAAVVVFCTTYALILPAITLETGNLSCGLEEHTHTADCYQLTCGKQEIFSHTHTGECYDRENPEKLICTLTQRTLHHHTASCYSQPAPACGQEEHPAHAHTDECYTSQPTLTCGLEESADHAHSETCYTAQPVLSCGLEETPGHTHTESCYPADFQPELICGQEDIPEHRHTEDCYLRVCEREEHTHTADCFPSNEDYMLYLNGTESGSGEETTEEQPAQEESVLGAEVVSGEQPAQNSILAAASPSGEQSVEEQNGEEQSVDTQNDGTAEIVENAAPVDETAAQQPDDSAEAGEIPSEAEPLPEEEPDPLEGMTDEELERYLESLGAQDGISMTAEGDTLTLPVKTIEATGVVYDPLKDVFSANVSISFTFEHDETQADIKAGVVYSYIYPEGIAIPPALLNSEKPLIDTANRVAGTYTFVQNEDGTYAVQAVFNADYVKQQVQTTTAVTGGISFGYEFNKSDFQGDGFALGGSEKAIPISGTIQYPKDETESYNIDVNKSGAVSADGKSLSYTVLVRSYKGTPNPISFSDTMPAVEGLILGEPTVTVEKGTENYTKQWDGSWAAGGDNNDWVPVAGVSPGYSGGEISMSLPRLTAETKTYEYGGGEYIQGETYRITYTYPITEQTVENVSPNNKVGVSATDSSKGQTVSDEDETTVPITRNLSYTLEKSGVFSENSIQWTVTVNRNQQNLVGMTLTDDMLSGEGVTNLNILPDTGIDRAYSSDGKLLSITFAADENGVNNNQYTITYDTPVEANWNDTPVNNQVTLDPDPNQPDDEKTVTAAVTVNGVQFNKSGTHNPVTEKLDWVITVNAGGLGIAGATLTDTMFSGLTESDVTISPTDSYIVQKDEAGNITGISFKSGTDGKNTQTYTISYSTEIPTNADGTPATSVTNTATLSPKDGTPGTPITVTPTVTVEEPSLSKVGSYDFDNQKISWTVTVNANNKNIANAVLTDPMLSQMVSGSLSVKNSSWQEVAETSGEYTVARDGDKVTKITFNAISDGVNTNQYIVTYSTAAPQGWSDQTVTNAAKLALNGKDITAPAEVTVPGGGYVEKAAGTGTVSGNTLTIPWTVTLEVPRGGLPAGTVITDDVTKNQWDGANAVSQWITGEQAEALKTATMTWTDYNGNPADSNGKAYDTVSLTPDQVAFTGETGAYTGFTITLADALVPPEGAAKLTFGYSTTSDLASVPIGQTAFYNYVNVGDKEASGTYTRYQPGVVKTDGDGKTENTTVANEGALTWLVKATVGNGCSKLTLEDTLPEGVTLTALQLTGWDNLNTELTVGEDGAITGGDANYTVSGTYAEGKVTLDITRANEEQSLADGSQFTLTVNCQVTDTAATESKTLTNTVTMHLDGSTIGTSSQTQEWTYEKAEQPVVGKNGQWQNDQRLLTYQVVLNPDGKDLDPNLDYLTLTDSLVYYNLVAVERPDPYDRMEGVPLSISLVQSSVKLYDVSDPENSVSVTDWKWKYSTQANEWNPTEITNLITATVPDATPLRLEYNYLASSGTPKDYSFDLNIQNTASLAQNYKDDSNFSGKESWKNQTSSGGIVASPALGLIKVDSENNGNALRGAVFSVYLCDATTGVPGDTPVKTYTTGEDGMVSISQMEKVVGGEQKIYEVDTLYLVKETQAPEGYALPENPQEFYFYFPEEEFTPPAGMDGIHILDLSKVAESFYVENTKTPTTSIQVEKKWQGKDGGEPVNVHSSVSFDLYQFASETPLSGGGAGESATVTFNVTKQTWDQTSACAMNNTVACKIGSTFTVVVNTWGTPSIQANGVTVEYVSQVTEADYSSSYTYQFDVSGDMMISGCADNSNNGSVTYSYVEPTASADAGPGETTTHPDGTKVGTYTISAENNWTTEIRNLPISGMKDGITVYYGYYVDEHAGNYTTAYENNNGIGSGTIVITNTESDNPVYSLPSTGGRGLTPYTVGGLLLMVSAGIPLMYIRARRKKISGGGYAE